MAYKQNPGRGPMMKTGRGIPLNMKSPLYITNGPGDESKKGPGDDKSKEKKARELAKKRAEEARIKAGKNEGDSKNVRTFTGEASYVVPGQKVERYAETPEEIAAWKKASEESKAKYRDKNIKVVETVSDTGVDKQKSNTPQPPSENKKNDGVYFFKGSNEHNMNFGGHTTYGRNIGKPDLSKVDTSYTRTPPNPISGRPNTFEYREATDRETKAMKSRFFGSTANPFSEGQTEAGWNNYLTQVENKESKLQSKLSERNKLKSKAQEKKEALKAYKAERAAKNIDARKKKR